MYIHTETLDVSSGQKQGLDTALKSAGRPWSPNSHSAMDA